MKIRKAAFPLGMLAALLTATFLLAALAALLAPARRTTKIDPMIAIRQE